MDCLSNTSSIFSLLRSERANSGVCNPSLSVVNWKSAQKEMQLKYRHSGISPTDWRCRMGIWLNPGNENFTEAVNAKIYVDKTMMIAAVKQLIRDGNKYICVSRPRRFGKTIAGNMLAAYYSKGCDSEELFQGLKISTSPDFKEKLNRYNVIQIDMNSEYQNVARKKDVLKKLKRNLKAELMEAYPAVKLGRSATVADALLKIYAATGDTFIIIMDEYDVLVREQADAALFDEYLSFLTGLFKSNVLRPAITLAYLTGILPVVRDKIQSKLNNFREYTILDAGPLAEFIGFTGDEVQSLCAEYAMDFAECRRWYDGYTQRGIELYNPESVVVSMEKQRYGSYWGKTSSYEVIADRIRDNFAGTKDAVIRMLAGESVSVNVTQYLNTMDSFRTMDDVLTYLLHVGYLTYDEDSETCRIPNGEVRQEWINAISVDPEYAVTDQIIKASEGLLEETLKGNEEAVAKALERSHIHVTSNRSYNNEGALQSAIYLAYLFALNKYNVFKELTTGKGFADVVYVPVKPSLPAMIIELKHNKSAEGAIAQIKEKQYFESLHQYQGQLLFVGINYDEHTKEHTCRIELFEKLQA